MMLLWLGFGIGYWFATIGAEQFSANIRATAAATIANMERGTVVGMTTLCGFLKPTVLEPHAATIVGFICFAIEFYSIITIPETHGRDLDFVDPE